MHTITPFQGCYTAIVTPFTRNGNLDLEAVDRLATRQLTAGVQGLVVLGTTGESPTITRDERVQLIERVLATTSGTVPVIVGTGTNSTASALAHAHQAEQLGADGLLVSSPYYNKPTQTGLTSHFTAIADSVNIPIMLYNVPGRTAVNIEPETVVRLAQHPRIVALKEASGDLEQIMAILRHVSSDFSVLSGDDALAWPIISMGGVGVVSVLSNLYPEHMQTLIATALAGFPAHARRLHERLLPMMHACFLQTNPLPIKTALAARGYIEEAFRLPLCPMDEPYRSELIASINAFDEQIEHEQHTDPLLVAA